MLAVDVNVLVSAFRDDAPDGPAMRRWLEDAVADPEPLGISDAVVVGAVRVLTHRRVFDQPMTVDEAWERVRGLLAAPGVVRLRPGPRHLELVEELCREGQATGNLVADAAHAATALEHGAVLVSKDRDFARFPRLRWRLPTSSS